MRKLLTLTLAAAALSGAAWAEEPLKSSLKAMLVEMNSEGKEVFLSAEEAAPGDIIEYRLAYENVSKDPLTGLSISVPIPAATGYVGGSAKASDSSIFEASLDNGENWSTEPVYKMVNGKKVIASPNEYTLVRWTPAMPLTSGEDFNFAYRVAVE